MVSIVHGYYMIDVLLLSATFTFIVIMLHCSLMWNEVCTLYVIMISGIFFLQMCTHNHLFTKVHKNQHGIIAWYWLLPWPA